MNGIKNTLSGDRTQVALEEDLRKRKLYTFPHTLFIDGYAFSREQKLKITKRRWTPQGTRRKKKQLLVKISPWPSVELKILITTTIKASRRTSFCFSHQTDKERKYICLRLSSMMWEKSKQFFVCYRCRT